MKTIDAVNEVKLDEVQAQVVTALAERRERIAAQANEQIGRINAALQKAMVEAAREAGIEGAQFAVEAREDGLWLKKAEEGDSNSQSFQTPRV